MTEDEAKTKWCPFARVGSSMEPGYTINRDVAGGEKTPLHTRCIASACMAWRWNPTAEQVRELREIAQTHLMEAKRLARAEQRPATQGYCGLAGSPR